MIGKNILITGGAGTLGRAIIHVAHQDNWKCNFTIYSTDTMKHKRVQKVYPDVKAVVGDIRDYPVLEAAIAGHDTVIHAAAVKHIPDSEVNVTDTLQVNVYGSETVAKACVNQDVRKVIGISTDKGCAAHNFYGATKFVLEKLWQQYQRWQNDTDFYLLRYGNVIESTGSVVEAWETLSRQGRPIKITDPNMTRFWLSPQQAVHAIMECLNYQPGNVFVPLLKSLSVGRLADYIAPEAERERIPIRPGEKIHETLVTEHEIDRTHCLNNGFLVLPALTDEFPESEYPAESYTSKNAMRLTKSEFDDILEDARELDEVYG